MIGICLVDGVGSLSMGGICEGIIVMYALRTRKAS